MFPSQHKLTFLKQVAEKFVEPLQIFIPLFKNVYV